MTALLSLLKLLPWQLYASVGAILALILVGGLEYRNGYNSSEARYAAATAQLRAQIAEQDAQHAAKLTQLNAAHQASALDLQSRLAAALAVPPVVRIVRVQNGPGPGLSCPAQSAGQLEAVRPDAGAAETSAEEYKRFRDRHLIFGAKLEECQSVVEDVLKVW